MGENHIHPIIILRMFPSSTYNNTIVSHFLPKLFKAHTNTYLHHHSLGMQELFLKRSVIYAGILEASFVSLRQNMQILLLYGRFKLNDKELSHIVSF